MKIIDLLNKIANDEILPSQIIYKGDVYYNVGNKSYESDYGGLLHEIGYTNHVCDEIEVLEDVKKIGKILMPGISFNLGFIDTNNKETVIREMNKSMQELYDRTSTLCDKINEIIEHINGDNNK